MIVFIKTHGRPDKQLTYDTLRKAGYTKKIIFVVDDMDDTADRLSKYMDEQTECKVFCKQWYVDRIDSYTNKPKVNVNLYAWCACEDIAEEMEEPQFIMADDDITGFRYRYVENGHLASVRITQNLDEVFHVIMEYMEEANIAASSPGIPQMYFNKDIDNSLWKYRVPYTFVFRNGKYKFSWVSEYEEDIITAINASLDGQYIQALPIVQRDTVTIGSNDGGMHDFYNNSFRRSQYGYISGPACRKINLYKNNWMCTICRDNTFQKLISSSFKKS